MARDGRASVAPPSRRDFRHHWDEIAHRCEKAAYHLHSRRRRRAARRHIDRLRPLISRVGHTGEAIVGESALALIAEYDREWQSALRHRRLEVRQILKLYGLFRPEQSRKTRRFVLEGYRKKEVVTRLTRARHFYHAEASPRDADAITELINVIRQASETPAGKCG